STDPRWPVAPIDNLEAPGVSAEASRTGDNLTEKDGEDQGNTRREPQHQHQQQRLQLTGAVYPRRNDRLKFHGDQGVNGPHGDPPPSGSTPAALVPCRVAPPYSAQSQPQLSRSDGATSTTAARAVGSVDAVVASLQVQTLSSLDAAAAATGVAIEKTALSPATIRSSDDDRRSPGPFASRKRLRSGTFARIINVPHTSNAIVAASASLDASDPHDIMPARAEVRCLRYDLRHDPMYHLQRDVRNGLRTEDLALELDRRQPRARTAAEQERIEIGGGNHSNGDGDDCLTARQAELATSRTATSAGESRASIEAEAAPGANERGPCVQLRRNRWCSPRLENGRRGRDERGSRGLLCVLPTSSGPGGSREGTVGEGLSLTSPVEKRHNGNLVRGLTHRSSTSEARGVRRNRRSRSAVGTSPEAVCMVFGRGGDEGERAEAGRG
ncbi:unnamed protein product, partial [Ectocarpus sp. 12 AP-2014]